MQPTDLTVSAVIERDGQYLMVEEITSGAVVLNQPGGHLETGESPEEAVIREVLEETGCDVACGELVGIYLWIHPQSRQQFLRIVYVASLLNEDESRPLDDGIIAKRWLSRADIEYRRQSLRTPIVQRCILDFEAGRRQSDVLFSDMLPLQHNVHAVIASADLV
ncbi:MAG: NUDIX hydrolase [Gammaproteobacteria bacterium]|jgi:8-oxo-dGTP pyrophosphatase MutT (NUDIX family)|nr:NUDIX hydrolase [Gammaproteobacteria bacterium]MDH3865193.1 NUDIX hydrolase [Gammaproteobacteria bacterium]NCF58383.1 NUDIX domain-containing protein [Gammaproteobacteria bacterium]